ncbi:MAG: nucleoside-diphosphate sugar epimerase/dehydratase [Psychrobacter sp.]|nr:nucleoside-diphosphate sugar epimerase/dehydratase [Psychrobacter sp.]
MTIHIDQSHSDKAPYTAMLADTTPVDIDKQATNKTYYAARWLLSLPRYFKRTILVSLDYSLAILCLFFALSLRYGTIESHIDLRLLLVYAAIPVIGLNAIGFYQGVTRIFFDAQMRRVLQLFIGLIIAVALVQASPWSIGLPRSVPLLFLSLLFMSLWFNRMAVREILSYGQHKHRVTSKNKSPCYENIIIYGAGFTGKALYEAIYDADCYRVVAFVDDDLRLQGAHLFGKKIYDARNLASLITKYDIDQVFLSDPEMSHARKRTIIDDLSEVSVKIKQLPSLKEIADGKVTVNTMRRVDILDVLDRQAVMPDTTLLGQDISGKHVLVTGAGGSIGSELCRQILQNKPQCLVLFELSEYALYAIHQELLACQASLAMDQPIELVAIIGNVNNNNKLQSIFEQYGIHTVYHAAAYKHVPLVEANPFEGVINNAQGTYHCVQAAINAHVETFVLISTDKAVRPTNVMGASKRLAELACQAMSQVSGATRISMVRFGNVLGSSGSVVPLFTKQIEKGGPITVTHPEVTRYFMTIPEAANLVIQAGAMARGGEVFVLDMGDPVKIVDLARRMVYLSGYDVKDEAHPDGDIEIVFNGLRPGEKLYEELIIGEDNIEKTPHPLIMRAQEHSFALADIEQVLQELNYRAKNEDVDWLKQQFKLFVAGYQDNSVSDSAIDNDSDQISAALTNPTIQPKITSIAAHQSSGQPNKQSKKPVRVMVSA